jgi:exodeoxyribonuclease VII small subunit
MHRETVGRVWLLFVLAALSAVQIMRTPSGTTTVSAMSAPTDQEPNFEQAMERLEEIVSAMEGECMALDEMVGNYEEGMRLLKVCRQRIENARRRVEMIAADADGKATLAPFDPATAEVAESLEEKARPVRRRTTPAKAEADEETTTDDIRLF